MASSSAMVPRGPREVTIAPVWETSTEEVSTDIEMAGTTNYTFTVPDFVASAVDSIQSQLRYFHAKLEDTEQMSLMTEVQQQELYVMQQRMGMFLKKVWEDCRAEAQSTMTFNEQRYEYVEAQCNMFGATIEARLAGHSQDTQRMQQSIESLYKRHEGLYEKTEITFGTVVNQVAELKATQSEALEKERRIRKRHEQTLRESAAVLDKKLEEAHRQIDYERQTRKEVAKEAKEAQSKWAMELRKVKDIQKRLKRGLSVDMSTLDLSPEEIPLPPGDDEDWRTPIPSPRPTRAETEELGPGERRPPTGSFYARRDPNPIVIDGVTYGPIPTQTTPEVGDYVLGKRIISVHPGRGGITQVVFEGQEGFFYNVPYGAEIEKRAPQSPYPPLPPSPVMPGYEGNNDSGSDVGSTMSQVVANKVAALIASGRNKVSEQRIRMFKQPKRNNPSSFEGEPKEFRKWWNSVLEFLDYSKGDFESDLAKIGWIGGFMKKKAQDWHQRRTEIFRDLGEPDDWTRYEHALKQHFTNDLEADEFIDKMEKMSYEGDIKDYLTKMDSLNALVGLKGAMWKRMIKKNLGSELLDRFSYVEIQDMPLDDDDWASRLKTCGLRMEKSKKERKFYVKDGSSKEKSPKSKQEDGKKRKFPADSVTLDDSDDRPFKKSKKESKSKGENSNQPEHRKAGEKKFTSESIALAGIPSKMIDERVEDKCCKRCAKTGHSWAYCRAPQPRTTSHRSETVAAGKRKAEDQPEEGSRPSKKGKEKAADQSTPTAAAYRQATPGPSNYFEADSDQDTEGRDFW
jgi:hypothetical protein